MAKAQAEKLSPLQLANGAKALLDEVATGKITGEEDRYSHTDLWDFNANVEGSKAAIAALRPVLEERDPALVKTLDTEFANVDAALAQVPRRRRLEAAQPADRGRPQGPVRRDQRPRRADQQGRRGGVPEVGIQAAPCGQKSCLRACPAGEPSRSPASAWPGWPAPAGIGAALITDANSRRGAAPATQGAVPFTGDHQAGIITPAQDRLHFVAFDVITKDRERLVKLLQDWTAAARRMTAGQDAGEIGAVERHPRGAAGRHRRGHRAAAVRADHHHRLRTHAVHRRRPARTASASPPDARPRWPTCPASPATPCEPAISGGDIAIQACANDPQVAVHAIRNLARIGMGVVSVRWSQLGFGRTSSTTEDQATPRNLFGFKDGTKNLKAEEPDLLRDHVWVQPGDGQDWMTGGSYLVTRKIRMLIETWDRESLAEQEAIVGRHKGSGAPLGQAGEFDEIDLAAMDDDGEPLVADHRARPAGPPQPEQRRPAAAPRLQLRGRLGRAGPAQRRVCSSSPTSATPGPRSCRCSAAWPGWTR